MILIDTGPLLALIDKADAHHRVCHETIADLEAQPFFTTWACLTEAMYFLADAGGYAYQKKLWKMLRDERVVALDLTPAERERAEELMAKYASLPMDLADATLVAVAESRRIPRVFTMDSDFRVYRTKAGGWIEMVP